MDARCATDNQRSCHGTRDPMSNSPREPCDRSEGGKCRLRIAQLCRCQSSSMRPVPVRSRPMRKASSVRPALLSTTLLTRRLFQRIMLQRTRVAHSQPRPRRPRLKSESVAALRQVPRRQAAVQPADDPCIRRSQTCPRAPGGKLMASMPRQMLQQPARRLKRFLRRQAWRLRLEVKLRLMSALPTE